MSTRSTHLSFLSSLKRAILLLPLILALCLPLPIIAQSGPYAEINSISYTNAAGGLTVTFNLVVNNLANQQIRIGMWFQDANGNGILHSGVGQGYRDSNGYLTFQRDETVLYDSSTFNNYSMFIPYDQFPTDVTEMYPFFNVFYNGQVILAYRDENPIQLTRSGGDCSMNGCGSADGFDVPDAPFLAWTTSMVLHYLTGGLVPIADTFKDACNTHDVCYCTAGKSQGDCDTEFRGNLLKSCSSTVTGFLDPACEVFALGYYEAVSDLGQTAFTTAQGTPPKGNILSCKAAAIDNDELVVYVFMRNEGGASGEYEVKLYSEGGSEVDEEPDASWTDVRSGGTHIFTLTTNWDPMWDIRDVGRSYSVALNLYDGGTEDTCTGELNTVGPNAQIVSVNSRKIGDWLGDDEFEACVTFANTGNAEGEFDVKLYSANGVFIDQEPDGYWEDLAAGYQTEICVGTDGIYESLGDLDGGYTVTVNEEVLGELARASGTVEAASANLCLENFVDRYGSDYNSFEMTTADPMLCMQACLNDGNCVSFSFVRPGIQGPNARCYLKNTDPGAYANDCCVSGLRSTCLQAYQ